MADVVSRETTASATPVVPRADVGQASRVPAPMAPGQEMLAWSGPLPDAPAAFAGMAPTGMTPQKAVLAPPPLPAALGTGGTQTYP